MTKHFMTGNSQIPKDILLNNLKELMPEIFSEGNVDWERLKATLGEDINFSNERYVLNWAGKSDAFRVLQAPSTRTLIPAKEESINFGETENIFIEGENLEVLKILQKSYFGKIKMIYIDPPYNTGSDSFIYPDKFSETKEEYQKRVGDKDEEGYMTREGMFRKNSKENGQYHSNWLNMMYPRLFLAKNLLKDDGAIFISIDDNEVHNLKLILNEIFGEENFIADIIWEKRFTRSNDAKMMASLVDHILFYRKSDKLDFLREQRTEKANSIYSNPDNDPNGAWTSVSYVSQRTKAQRPNLSYKVKNPFTGVLIEHPTNAWKFSEEQYKIHEKEGKLYWGKEGGHSFPRLKKYLSEVENRGMVPINLWNYRDTGSIDDGTKEVDTIIGKDVFDYPKPSALIKRMLQMVCVEKNDIVLDFFSGSGTTGYSVLDLNQETGNEIKFICVQLPELCDEKSEAHKQGYKSIADIAKERIRRVIKIINEENQGKLDFNPDERQDLGFKVFKLSDSNFKLWRQQGIETVEELEKQMELFTDPVSKEALTEFMVYELLIKSGFDLNCQIKHENNIYFVNSNEMILLLESVSKEIISTVIKTNPQKVVALDKLFEGNDQLKTNTALQMKDAGIDFKTI